MGGGPGEHPENSQQRSRTLHRYTVCYCCHCMLYWVLWICCCLKECPELILHVVTCLCLFSQFVFIVSCMVLFVCVGMFVKVNIKITFLFLLTTMQLASVLCTCTDFPSVLQPHSKSILHQHLLRVVTTALCSPQHCRNSLFRTPLIVHHPLIQTSPPPPPPTHHRPPLSPLIPLPIRVL